MHGHFVSMIAMVLVVARHSHPEVTTSVPREFPGTYADYLSREVDDHLTSTAVSLKAQSRAQLKPRREPAQTACLWERAKEPRPTPPCPRGATISRANRSRQRLAATIADSYTPSVRLLLGAPHRGAEAARARSRDSRNIEACSRSGKRSKPNSENLGAKPVRLTAPPRHHPGRSLRPVFAQNAAPEKTILITTLAARLSDSIAAA